MNDLNEVLGKRLRGMAVRILACIEHTVRADLDDMGNDEKFTFSGGELKVIRSEILNAAGDTTRSLGSLFNQSNANKRVISREVISILNTAKFEVIELDDETVPVFTVSGEFLLLGKIRDDIGAGIVYNTTYRCVGIEDVASRLLPFLDITTLAGIKLGSGDYKTWRDTVCKLYLEGLV